MGTFKKYNLIGGWMCFLIAAIVYLMTMEPTASLWDCSEFIATSYKLEVGHPPGAPLFMMLGRLFSAFTSPQMAGMMVNAMSSICSAATIMFLFWSITHLVRRSYKATEEELTSSQLWVSLGSGLIGAMAYAFTDTFWFSAIEAEVYAMSSLFTAVVFWAILKWENVADQPNSNRWLVLLAFLTGLALGVHLLNLLVIPAIVLIYYFKKYPKVTTWGVVKALAVSFAIVLFVLGIFIPKTVQVGAFVDRIFVNSLGAGVNWGFTLFILALFAATGWLVYYTHKKGKVLANTIILCFGVMLLGFSSYASVLIRASANPPMNSNNPSDPYKLLSFLNRDQYGSRPLLKGEYYSSPVVGVKYKDVYYLDPSDSKYHKAETMKKYVFADGFEFFFPRMHVMDKKEAYKNWVDIKGKNIPFQDGMVNVPTFGENMKFFFGYHLNFMYWRYFLWNFAGRQSDIQSTGEITNGNWISGIKPIDALFLGPQDNLPDEMENNRGRNKYFFLPFILGIVGLVSQSRRDGKNFWVVMTVFVMTGLAVAVYLNMPPDEPRERDYVFAASFYAFAIWIGFGVAAIYEAIKKWTKKDGALIALAATAIAAVVPVILVAQNWDDHDRSGRYIARDIGYNYMSTTLPNSIIMNYGDNDTFPLWYVQEVESVRTDVRIMNMSYLYGEWYIDQMKVRTNESAPVPFSIPANKYTYTNENLRIIEEYKEINIKTAIDFVISDHARTQKMLTDGSMIDYMPTKTLLLPVNKENAIKSGIVKAEDAHLMEDTIRIDLGKRDGIGRNNLMLLDLLANFDWSRPLYFTSYVTLMDFGLHEYLQTDGFAYRFVPIKTSPSGQLSDIGRIDTECLYKNLMEVYRYGGLNKEHVYVDYFTNYTINNVQGRRIFARLGEQLLSEGDTVRAVEVLDKSLEVYPLNKFNKTHVMYLPLIEAYFKAGEFEKGAAVFEDYSTSLKQNISYYLRFENGKMFDYVIDKLKYDIWIISNLYTLANDYDQKIFVNDIGEFLKSNKLM